MQELIAVDDLNAIMLERAAGEMDTQAVTFDSETGTPQQQSQFSLSQEFANVAPANSEATPQVGFSLPGLD